MKAGFILNGEFINDPRVINEARILAGRGNQVYVLNIPRKKVPEFTEFEKNIFLVRVPVPYKVNNYLFALENTIPLFDCIWYNYVINYVIKYEIKILHSHDLYMARPAKWVADRFNIPLILDLHENYPAAVKEYFWANRFPSNLIVRPGKWKRKERKYLSYADRIIVLSSGFRDHLLSEYSELGPGRIEIYPNVPDIKKMLSYAINKNIMPLVGRKIVFYFGVISKRRGILTTLEAVEKAVSDNPAIHLLLIGPIDKAEKDIFSRAFMKNNIREHIAYYPWKDIGDFPSLASASAVCISPILKNPQHESGVANKVFQYMLFGKPILVSDCEPQVEIVRKTGCGLIFKSGDASDMAMKLTELLNDDDKCKMMGEKGRKAVHDEYNTEKQGEAIIKVYEELFTVRNDLHYS
jgi:glycosyltransferase involved in cell wall biosynthesis